MKKISVYELGKELKVSEKSLIEFLLIQGYQDVQHDTFLENEDAELVRGSVDELEPIDESEVHLKPPFIVKNIADAIGEKANKLVAEFMKMGVFAAINQSVDEAKVRELLESKDLKLVVDKREKIVDVTEGQEDAPENIVFDENAKDRIPRPAVVAVMGHVDHGKTTLLDKLRGTKVTDGEAGGITQHTAASLVERKGNKVAFLDTPGHAAFSAMRERGANITDVVLLLVAADDGVNAQTKEAIKHILKAQVPFIVVMNKIDLPNSNPDETLNQLQNAGILTEEWGGEIGCCRVSAKTGEGLDELVERIALEAEINELTGNPKLPGRGTIIESQVETGRGAIASVIIKDGSIKVGDTLIAGEFYGKVKALINSNGKKIKKAGPSEPVTVLGLSGAPEVGAVAAVCKNDKEARKLSEERLEIVRQQKLNKPKITSFQELLDQVEENEKKTHRVIIKTDARGTGEAIATELMSIASEKINLEIIQNSIGAITNNDVELAASAGAKILGFHVRTNPGVNKTATTRKVDLKLYSIIYELIDDVRETMTGLLDKIREEVSVGQAEILEIFKNKQTKICGCIVRKGKIKVGAHAKVYRDKEMIYNGSVKSLRRFKDDVKEVGNGLECGINLDNFDDFDKLDMIEIYDYKEKSQSL